MTDDTNEPESNFAEFEANAKADPDERRGDDKPDPNVNDTLELGSEEAPEAKPEDVEADKEKRSRSHSPIQRINTLTARLREAERERDELRQAKGQPEGPQRPDPYAKNADGSDKYDFGEADPKYQEDLTDWKVDVKLAEVRTKEAETSKKDAAQNEVVGKLHEGMAAIEKAGPEKYTDFEEKITEALEARGGEPLHPMLSIGIAVSPAGADLAYRFANDPGSAEKIEALAQANPQSAAVAFGELEGEFVEGDDDLNLADPMDMARMLGRMKARLAGKTPKAAAARKVTQAPEPPEHRSRGANGQFETRPDTTDFAAFEAKAKREAAARA